MSADSRFKSPYCTWGSIACGRMHVELLAWKLSLLLVSFVFVVLRIRAQVDIDAGLSWVGAYSGANKNG